ncbi:TetR/AcrR family transcriptional regulator [Lichenihabitans sp. Uapishka_5]|uniref:TetR/AcrR family transcriptional regulator n=1 Tax=Lichenihabitans sp. Uapishka_5 TaxID=3037302 RepID=UPI0029E7E072|nr:TetR/AcrR family transcriptional regulator [Lichenihabitans sp. Uapishka_5]MDX7950221.1 TetR/AcrR family transcriptional regulator [Lichenihabitans sp. Uapishka_5]
MGKIPGGAEVAVSCCPTARPRERILSTARDLFRRYGIRGIGVDTIAEAAGTNKMTLYRHFGSKDDLVCECLKTVAREGSEIWDRFSVDHPGDPTAQLHQWVRYGAACIASDGRGCDLANAAVELTEPDHPARRLIEDVKRDYRDRLARLCAAAGVVQAELLADTLSLMLEGARVSRQSVGVEGPSARFLRMSEAVIAAFKGA